MHPLLQRHHLPRRSRLRCLRCSSASPTNQSNVRHISGAPQVPGGMLTHVDARMPANSRACREQNAEDGEGGSYRGEGSGGGVGGYVGLEVVLNEVMRHRVLHCRQELRVMVGSDEQGGQQHLAPLRRDEVALMLSKPPTRQHGLVSMRTAPRLAPHT